MLIYFCLLLVCFTSSLFADHHREDDVSDVTDRDEKSGYDSSAYGIGGDRGRKPHYEGPPVYFGGHYGGKTAIIILEYKLEIRTVKIAISGQCGQDGFYYKDDYSFVMCTHGIAYVQRCAPGTRNGAVTRHDVTSTNGMRE